MSCTITLRNKILVSKCSGLDGSAHLNKINETCHYLVIGRLWQSTVGQFPKARPSLNSYMTWVNKTTQPCHRLVVFPWTIWVPLQATRFHFMAIHAQIMHKLLNCTYWPLRQHLCKLSEALHRWEIWPTPAYVASNCIPVNRVNVVAS